METRRCVKCFKKAKIWSGHVIDKHGGGIIAGWCSQKCMYTSGFFGHYRKEMGKKDDNFSRG